MSEETTTKKRKPAKKCANCDHKNMCEKFVHLHQNIGKTLKIGPLVITLGKNRASFKFPLDFCSAFECKKLMNSKSAK